MRRGATYDAGVCCARSSYVVYFCFVFLNFLKTAFVFCFYIFFLLETQYRLIECWFVPNSPSLARFVHGVIVFFFTKRGYCYSSDLISLDEGLFFGLKVINGRRPLPFSLFLFLEGKSFFLL